MEAFKTHEEGDEVVDGCCDDESGADAFECAGMLDRAAGFEHLDDGAEDYREDSDEDGVENVAEQVVDKGKDVGGLPELVPQRHSQLEDEDRKREGQSCKDGDDGEQSVGDVDGAESCR